MTEPTTIIDHDKCTGCGLCVEVCPADTLALIKDKAQVVGDHSLHCDHCAAICPEGAIRVEGVLRAVTALEAIRPGDSKTIGPLLELVQNRRSTRVYKTEPVNETLLNDLTKIGVMAPSGTNSQTWAFTIVKNRAGMIRFASAIGAFYERLNKMARNPLLRLATRLFSGGELSAYYRDYYDSVEDALRRWRDNNEDILFHEAPAAIVVSTRPGASCPKEDALLATGNILLAAEALGLGTVLIGYAVEAMKRDPAIGRLLGIGPGEKIHAVIAIGHPNVTYTRPAGRRPYPVRFF